MKLKERMFVRTKYGINKIDKTFYTVSGVNHSYIELENCYIDDENDLRQGISIENIIKASFNIIDLIEEGDVINYEYPTGLGNVAFRDVFVTSELLEILQNGENNHEYKIKNIITHECFENMKYEVN